MKASELSAPAFCQVCMEIYETTSHKIITTQSKCLVFTLVIWCTCTKRALKLKAAFNLEEKNEKWREKKSNFLAIPKQ